MEKANPLQYLGFRMKSRLVTLLGPILSIFVVEWVCASCSLTWTELVNLLEFSGAGAHSKELEIPILRKRYTSEITQYICLLSSMTDWISTGLGRVYNH